MASKGDVLINAWTTKDYMINPYRECHRFTHNIGIVRTVRRNGDASKYDSFQGQYDFDRPETMRSVPATGVYIVPRKMFISMSDEDIAKALGGRAYSSIEEIRTRILALS